MIRVLIADGMEKDAVESLVCSWVWVVDQHYEEEDLKKQIKDFDVVVVRSATKLKGL